MGARYDPATNAWTATSVGDNVPSPRSGFSVIWSGEEMIVWGNRATRTLALEAGTTLPPIHGGRRATDQVSRRREGITPPSGRETK